MKNPLEDDGPLSPSGQTGISFREGIVIAFICTIAAFLMIVGLVTNIVFH